jgi:phosphatidylserine/phosphatidylglycerophosphate/cardiolipin synthase-like enzyme
MAGLLRSPWASELQELVGLAESSLLLCAPYVGYGPCRIVVQEAERGGRSAILRIGILTDLSRDNLLSGATDAASLLWLAKAIPKTTVRFLPRLHAKVYIADERRAIVTSSNLTDSGLLRNFEYGVSFDDAATVAAVRTDILQYSNLASPVDERQLGVLAEIAGDLRDLSQMVEQSANRQLRREFDRRLAAAEHEILRVRVSGRTAHAIFADTILHLLRSGPLRTVEINQRVQRIHPDLCDDSVDRVIDGHHFGKKWKHGVRTAQVFLRRAGRIERTGDRWRLTP